MKHCYSTTSFSLRRNGSLVEFFNGSRGLRLGDLLSPFLFLIVVEASGVLLAKAFNGGLIEGFQVGGNGLMVTHLQFTKCCTFLRSLG